MNRTSIAASFGALKTNPDKRTKMGRFREVADLVEDAVRSGVHRSAILATLREHGLDLTPASLNTYLTRVRQEKASAPQAASPALPASAPASTPRPVSQAPTPAAPAAGPAPSLRQILTASADLEGARRWMEEKLKKEEQERRARASAPSPTSSA